MEQKIKSRIWMKSAFIAVLAIMIVLCTGVIGTGSSVHAQDVSSITVNVQATTPDDNLIYPQDLQVNYSKFSDLGLTITNDDPGFITPIHVLASYYQSRGADSAAMSQYIDVSPDGTINRLKGQDGEWKKAAGENSAWAVIDLFNGQFRDAVKIDPLSVLSDGMTINIVGYNAKADQTDTATTYFAGFSINHYYAVGDTESELLNKFLKLDDEASAVDSEFIQNYSKKVVYKETESGTVVPAVTDGSDPDCIVTHDNTKTDTVEFKKPGNYYISTETTVTDGTTTITTTRSLNLARVFATDEEKNINIDYSLLSFNGNETNIGESFSMYSQTYYGSNISWSTDCSRITFPVEEPSTFLSMDINVDRTGMTEDVPFTMTATLTNGTQTLKKVFNCRIVYDSDTYYAKKDLNAIMNSSTLRSNFEGTFTSTRLIYSASQLVNGRNGSKITYTTDRPDLVQYSVVGGCLQRKITNDDLLSDTPYTTTIISTHGQATCQAQLTGNAAATQMLKDVKVSDENGTVYQPDDKGYHIPYKKGAKAVTLKLTFVPKTTDANALGNMSLSVHKNGDWDPIADYNLKYNTENEITVDLTGGDIKYIEIRSNRSVGDDENFSSYNIYLEQVSDGSGSGSSPLPTGYTAYWGSGHRNNYNEQVVSDSYTPRTSAEIGDSWTSLISYAGEGMNWGKWSYPIIVNDNIYVAGTIRGGDSYLTKLDINGNIIGKRKISTVPSGGGYTAYLGYGDGMIFVPTASGIAAYNADDLSELWKSTTSGYGSQGSSPIVYHDGYVYSGSTNGDGRNGGLGSYYCFKAAPADDSDTTPAGTAIWTLTDMEEGCGFYWSGAAVVGNYLYVPCDSGYVYSIDIKASIEQKTPVVVDKINNNGGETESLRSGIAYDEATNAIYYPSKSSKLYKVGLGENGKFDRDSVKSIAIDSTSYTDTPVIYNGRLYIGKYVINTSDLSLIYTADIGVGAYAGGENGMTLNASYATEDNNQTVYVYGHSNTSPDNICVLKDSTANNAENPGTVETLWTNNLYPQFTTSYLMPAPNGSIFFVNDTSNLFCLKSKVTSEQVDAENQAQPVVNQIQALPEADSLTLDNESAVTAARTAFDALGQDVQKYVSEDITSRLSACENKIAALKQEKTDQAAADLVIAQINSLPAVITSSDLAAVSDAQQAFENLTAAQQTLITNKDVLNSAVTAAARITADQSAAKAVSDEIRKLNPDTLVLNDKGTVVSVNTRFNNLTVTQKQYVSQGDQTLLADAVAKIAELEKQADDQQKAGAAAAAIAGISSDVKLADKPVVEAAQIVYNALTSEQQAMVPEASIKKLNAAVETIKKIEQDNQKAADDVTAAVNAIGTVTLASEGAINDADQAYQKLTDDQKALLSADTLQTLSNAKDKLSVLKADKAAADNVISLIQQLPDQGRLTAADQIASDAAADAYNKLSDTQKELVGNELKTKLDDAVQTTALISAREDAVKTLESYKNAQAYDKDNQVKLKDTIAAARKAIENAASVDEIQGILATAKADMDKLPTATSERPGSGDSQAAGNGSGTQDQTPSVSSGMSGASVGSSVNAGTGIEEAYPAYLIMLALCTAAAGALAAFKGKKKQED